MEYGSLAGVHQAFLGCIVILKILGTHQGTDRSSVSRTNILMTMYVVVVHEVYIEINYATIPHPVSDINFLCAYQISSLHMYIGGTLPIAASY